MEADEHAACDIAIAALFTNLRSVDSARRGMVLLTTDSAGDTTEYRYDVREGDRALWESFTCDLGFSKTAPRALRRRATVARALHTPWLVLQSYMAC